MSKLFLILLLIVSSPIMAFDKIIGGEIPSNDHPGKFNTVAFVKKENGKVFCSGSIISKRMILTAKHCLIDKKVSDFLVFFGPDTNNLKEGETRTPEKMEVRHPKDWQMMFPSFDVAWVLLKKDIPAKFKPLPILGNQSELPQNPEIHLAGFGNSSQVQGQIQAGKRFTTTTNLKKYYDNSRFFHILLFEGKEGKGACHGDSGGPAYIKKKEGWYIVGVTNGFDVVLTPKSMIRTSDEEFPYMVKCEKNQILYSFAGAHGDWIEKTSGQRIKKSKPFLKADREVVGTHQSIQSWCLAKDFGSPRWNFLKYLLDLRIDQLPQEEGESFYNDCVQVESYLNRLQKISLTPENDDTTNYSLSPIHLLNIEEIKLLGWKPELINIKVSERTPLKRLYLSRSKLGDLKPLIESQLEIEELDLTFSKLKTLENIHFLTVLRRIDLSRTEIDDFSPLSQVRGLEGVDLAYTSFSNLSLFNGAQLKSLILGANPITNLSLEGMGSLAELTISSMPIENLNFLIKTPRLKELNLPGLGIQNLDILTNLPLLESLNLTGNKLKNLYPLRGLKKLKRLRLFGNPIARGEVLKDENNCPSDGPLVLSNFCLR